jgi:hypothetical protein
VWLSAYIHQNPKVAAITNSLEDYKWSSYPEFINSAQDDLCEREIILKQFRSIKDFQNFTEESYEIIKNRKKLKEELIQFLLD